MTHVSSDSFGKRFDSLVILLQFFLTSAFSHIGKPFNWINIYGISEVLKSGLIVLLLQMQFSPIDKAIIVLRIDL